jgi:transcriptional regulator with XRE-family HTH domain
MENHIKVRKWLSEQMGVNPSTVSKWCTNTLQPDITSLLKIADLSEVDIKELIVRESKAYLLSQSNLQLCEHCIRTPFLPLQKIL